MNILKSLVVDARPLLHSLPFPPFPVPRPLPPNPATGFWAVGAPTDTGEAQFTWFVVILLNIKLPVLVLLQKCSDNQIMIFCKKIRDVALSIGPRMFSRTNFESMVLAPT